MMLPIAWAVSAVTTLFRPPFSGGSWTLLRFPPALSVYVIPVAPCSGGAISSHSLPIGEIRLLLLLLALQSGAACGTERRRRRARGRLSCHGRVARRSLQREHRRNGKPARIEARAAAGPHDGRERRRREAGSRRQRRRGGGRG